MHFSSSSAAGWPSAPRSGRPAQPLQQTKSGPTWVARRRRKWRLPSMLPVLGCAAAAIVRSEAQHCIYTYIHTYVCTTVFRRPTPSAKTKYNAPSDQLPPRYRNGFVQEAGCDGVEEAGVGQRIGRLRAVRAGLCDAAQRIQLCIDFIIHLRIHRKAKS